MIVFYLTSFILPNLNMQYHYKNTTHALKRRFVICILHKFPVRILKSESDRKKYLVNRRLKFSSQHLEVFVFTLCVYISLMAIQFLKKFSIQNTKMLIYN